jgi:hypothetical protein
MLQPGVVVNIDVCPSVDDPCPNMRPKHLLQGRRVEMDQYLANKVLTAALLVLLQGSQQHVLLLV